MTYLDTEADALLLREQEQDAPVLCGLIWLGCLVWVMGSWWVLGRVLL